MLSDITFGQYYPASSFIHKMDARIKLLALILYIVIVFVVKNFYGFLVVYGVLLFATLLAKVPITSLIKSASAVVFVIVLTFILNIFFYKTNNPTYLFWIITKEALEFSTFMALRLLALVFFSMLLNLTTTPVALTDGIESLLKPLKVIKFPVHELALVMSIALRFIPILMGEADRIVMAQKARGADFESGNILKRAKAMLPVLIPLLISSFRRAEELGDAMDSRCYSSSSKRTKFRKLKTGWRDLVAILFTAIVFTAVILLNNYVGGLI